MPIPAGVALVDPLAGARRAVAMASRIRPRDRGRPELSVVTAVGSIELLHVSGQRRNRRRCDRASVDRPRCVRHSLPASPSYPFDVESADR